MAANDQPVTGQGLCRAETDAVQNAAAIFPSRPLWQTPREERDNQQLLDDVTLPRRCKKDRVERMISFPISSAKRITGCGSVRVVTESGVICQGVKTKAYFIPFDRFSILYDHATVSEELLKICDLVRRRELKES